MTAPTNGSPRFQPKDRPLRRDVGFVGALLGDLLRDLEGEGVFEAVEGARLASRRRRKGDPDSEADLARRLEGLSAERALQLVRAFSAYFSAVNMAEQVHRLRRRIAYRREGRDQPGGLRAALRALRDEGHGVEEVARALGRIRVEPVFTAHPTEAVRRTLLRKDQRLARLLVDRFSVEDWTPEDVASNVERIALELASGWQTEEQLAERPTVADEVEQVLFFLAEVLYRVAPAIAEDLERAIREVYGVEMRQPTVPVRFASWVGGDMDGNPSVGAATIRASLERHMQLALRRYRTELETLHEHLSQSTSRVGVDPAVLARLEECRSALGDGAPLIPDRYDGMPYRQLLWFCDERLARKARGEEGGYGPPAEFRADLELMRDSLREHRGARAGGALLDRLLRRVEVFGFHLASLDARQDAEVHRRVVGELLGVEGFAALDGAARTERLSAALRGEVPTLGHDASAEARSTVEVFRALADARERFGPAATGVFVVSMAQGPDDALAVLLLARVGGCMEKSGVVPLDVAPLLETVDDLEAGPATLEALAADPTYREHVAARGGKQMVMLGYSDSNKDGGITASRLGLDRAQARIVGVAREAGLDLVFFHGRGGSISRGGAKPAEAILAAPAGAVDGCARTTEQGEVLAAKFGLRGLAVRTLEQSVAALLLREVRGTAAAPAPSERSRAVGETMVAASRAKYRALVHDDADFPALFQGMTPIDVIERLQIGSRPARRREMRGVQDLRAIPWVFAWTQCRVVLPGWFGVGSGLTAAVEEHGLAAVRAALADWPALRALASDVEMVLAKSDLAIAARYAPLAGDVGARLFPVVEDEHARTTAAILEVLEQDELLASEPTLQRSIRLRNPYVDPMSFLQADALGRWREGGREDEALERLLVQTVRGIARGLRNTG
ncbi:MAG: phosphoenolpyruvate carboxylase [Planctomycetota bacterium]|nr:phosphoenolpyruvate carboxylase [Planctomycetota bacterium]